VCLAAVAVTPERILTVNTGSSSVKLGLYEGDRLVDSRSEDCGGHGVEGFRVAIERYLMGLDGGWPNAVGHRIVHGGTHYTMPCRITADLLARLRELVPLLPEHLPQAIEAVEAIGQLATGATQVACFDSAFHRTMPRIARLLPLPRRYLDAGVMRYGFHGLSYEYVAGELRRLDPERAGGLAVVAHLGNGASMAALREGVGVETTMGFTPTGGLVMGTRTGDLDPGVLVYLREQEELSAEALSQLVNQKAGLLGISELSSDMRDLLASDDPRAAEAVELFCYQARKYIGSLVTVLGGLDTLVFTGGIGEHAGPIRWRICQNLEHLGVELDRCANDEGAALVSSPRSRVTVRVLATDEDLMIARHTRELLELNESDEGNRNDSRPDLGG
jgi:acetate kinase